MNCVYHLCAHDFHGTTLYPLYGLREQFPDLYRRENEKYNERESVLEFVVPRLGKKWGETVNLSALDPRLLVAERRTLGVSFSRLLQRRLVCIPTERIQGLPAVRYDSVSHWINSSPGEVDVPLTPPAEEFTPFDTRSYREASEVPQLHREYLIRQRDRGQLALGFVFVPHVLVASPIDIKGLEMIDLDGSTSGG